MNAHESIERLEQLLVHERDAIRRVDGSTVEALADEKVTLLNGMDRETLRADSSLTARFRKVSTELRNNAVILAHARNCLRDVVQLRTPAPAPATYSANGQLGTAGRKRLSITG